MATEIANAYIALYTKMPGVKNDIAKSLGASDVKSAVSKSGEGLGSSLMTGLDKIGKAGAIAVGGALAAGLGTALVKGFRRLDSLDQAESKLRGLGHSAATVDKIMDNALESVKGTAFGMDEAATSAANAVAAGIKPGEDLERTLKAVADASTIAGTDMGTMGAIFNKVAASNKVQMDVINQLHDAGVPALALLADQLGVTAEEASKMASRGEIDFETFRAAMENGMGGAALESGKTFSGAMDNIMASLGRVGANLLSGLFPQMKDGLTGVLDAMAPLEEVASNVGEAIGKFFTWVSDNWHWLQAFAIGIGIVVAAVILWTTVQWLLNVALTANPIGLIITAIGLLIGAIILLVQNWDTVVAWLKDVWDGFVNWIVSVIDGFVSWWNSIWSGLGQWIINIWNSFVGWVKNLWNGFVSWIAVGLAKLLGKWTSTWQKVGNFFRNIWQGFVGIVKGIWNNLLGWIEGGINGAIDLINKLIRGVNAVGGAVGIHIDTIPRVNIPRLADGGIVKARPGGILANIGEGRYDEAVVPLSPAVLAQLGGGEVVQNNEIHMHERDPRVLLRQLGRELNGALA